MTEIETTAALDLESARPTRLFHLWCSDNVEVRLPGGQIFTDTFEVMFAGSAIDDIHYRATDKARTAPVVPRPFQVYPTAKVIGVVVCVQLDIDPAIFDEVGPLRASNGGITELRSCLVCNDDIDWRPMLYENRPGSPTRSFQ